MPIHCDINESIATVRIEGANKANACGYDMFADLTRLLHDELDNDPAVKAIILTGTGDFAFTVGADMKMADELQKSGKDQEVYGTYPIYYLPWPGTMARRSRTPLIAAIRGWCLGAGCILVSLSASIRLATPDAKFGYTEIKRAMAGGSAMARSAVQMHYAAHMTMSVLGEHIDAQTALRSGFINEVVAPEALLTRAREIAERITEAPRLSIRAERFALHYGEQATPGIAATTAAASAEFVTRDPEVNAAIAALVRDVT